MPMPSTLDMVQTDLDSAGVTVTLFVTAWSAIEDWLLLPQAGLLGRRMARVLE